MAEDVNMNIVHNSYMNKLDQANRAHKQEVSELKKQHKHIQTEQKESYDTQRAETEDSYKSAMKNMSESQKTELDRKALKFQESINKEKQAFHDLSKKHQEDFKYRLDKINHDYNKLRNSENNYHTEKNEHDRQRYKKTLGEIQGDYNSKIKKYEAKTMGEQGAVRQKYLDDKHNLVKDYENKIGKITEQHTKTNNTLKGKITHDLEEMRRSQRQDLHTTRENARKNFERLKHAYADASLQQEDEFKHIKEQIGKDTMENNTQRNRDFERAFARQADLHRRSENQLRNQLQGSGTRNANFNRMLATTNQKQTNTTMENKFNEYNNERERISKHFKSTADTMHDKYKADMANKTERFKNTIEAQKNNDAVSRLEERIAHQNKYDIMTHKFNERYQNDKADFERNMFDKSNDYTTKLNNVRNSYERQLKDIRRKNEFHMKDYKQNVHYDKKRYYDKMEAAMKDEIRRKDKNADIKYRTMNDNHDSVNRKLKRDVARLDIDIKDQRDNLRADFQEVLSFERAHAEMQREADFDAYKRLSIKKQTELHEQIKGLHESYQLRLEKAKYGSDKKIAKMQRDYENQLTRLRKKSEADIRKAKADDKSELHRVKLALETEKEAQRQKYEEQIREIKRTYQAQMDRLSEFHMNQINDVQQS